jgi:hypothetical protein
MVRLVRVQLWRLPLNFFEGTDETWRYAEVERVTVPALPRTEARQLPSMSRREELAVVAYCSLLASPLLFLLLLIVFCWFHCWRALGLLIALVVTLVLQPLPHTREARMKQVGILLARYFALEILFDRADAGPLARVACTRACNGFGITDVVLTPTTAKALAAGGSAVEEQPQTASLSSSSRAPMINMATPHGVMNFGAVSFCWLSRWLVGSDQVTAVAGAVQATPGLRQFAAPLWPISAGRSALMGRLQRGQDIGIIPDGINGIFSTNEAEEAGTTDHVDAVEVGKKRGLMRLALQSNAMCMVSYFVGTLNLYTVWQDRWGLLRWISRKTRLSLFLFYGRWGLPIPRRHPLTAIATFLPRPVGGARPDPTAEELDAHHELVYGALIKAYDACKAAAGLPEGARLVVK